MLLCLTTVTVPGAWGSLCLSFYCLNPNLYISSIWTDSISTDPRAKVRFLYQCSDHLSHSKNFTSLFPLIFLSKHISLYALGRIRWILDIIWPLNQHFKLKNQRNWLNQVWMWKFWNVMNCILLHWYKHLTLVWSFIFLALRLKNSEPFDKFKLK